MFGSPKLVVVPKDDWVTVTFCGVAGDGTLFSLPTPPRMGPKAESSRYRMRAGPLAAAAPDCLTLWRLPSNCHSLTTGAGGVQVEKVAPPESMAMPTLDGLVMLRMDA